MLAQKIGLEAFRRNRQKQDAYRMNIAKHPRKLRPAREWVKAH